MSILGRLSTFIKSNVNDMIDSMQDPAKEIDQVVRDMEDAARAARSEVAQCIAEEKRLAKRVEALDAEARTWEERAGQAVRAGDDALAKEALKRKGDKDAEKLETEKALQEQKVNVDQLTAGLKALDARVKDVKLRQGSLRERARMNKPGASKTSTNTSAFEDFERMASKVDAVEAEAQINDELAGGSAAKAESDRKLRELTDKAGVEDALEALKKKLGK